jgi:maltose phosphorylase
MLLSPCTFHTSFIRQDGHGLYFLLKNIRLDLDDYNKEVEEGCHITSMAGTWMSIVEGFGGMRVKNDTLNFLQNSKTMERLFLVNFRNQL